MADKTLSTEAREVIARTTIDGTTVILPPGQLARPLYEEVDKALRNAGGRWKRGKGHIFPGDPRPKIEAMLSNGVSVDKKKRDQAFFTPDTLAAQVAEIADVRGSDVFEPEAGEGALVTACLNAGAARVYCVEQNPELAGRISKNSQTIVHVGDFLSMKPAVNAPEYMAKRGRFHRMNPPFTRDQDIKHVLHAWRHWLIGGGRLTAIMLDAQDRPRFRDLLTEIRADDYEIATVGRGAFKESGTNVPTIVLRIDSDVPF